jgi:spermidine synthase
MQKYDGLLIHQCYDENGILDIVEANGIRSLHLGSHHRQSSMSVQAPQQLYLAYVRAMLACLCFRENVDETLMVGLGGGSLAKFFLYHFPGCRIKVIEYRRSVVKIARSHFGLPLDQRLKIVIDDGGHYICQRVDELQGKYGLLFVDAFDEHGISTSVHNEAFFNACKNLLQDDGIMVINLWGTDKALFEQCAWYLGRTFGWKILFLPVRGKGNIIGLAFAEGVTKKTFKNLQTRATELEQHYQIEFPTYITDIRKNNASIIDKVIKK